MFPIGIKILCEFANTFQLFFVETKLIARTGKSNLKIFFFIEKKGLQYYDISAKSNYNFEKPFLYVARKLTGNNSCHFKEAPALAPPTVTIDPAQIKAMEENVKKAAQAPLPDEDDD